jgi:hypothetical protein
LSALDNQFVILNQEIYTLKQDLLEAKNELKVLKARPPYIPDEPDVLIRPDLYSAVPKLKEIEYLKKYRESVITVNCHV